MELEKKYQFITDEDGNKSVVIPVEDYEGILEDIQDLAAIAERKEEGSLSLEDLKKNLKADGLL